MATKTTSTFSRLHFKEPSVHHTVGTLPDGAGLPIAYRDLVARGQLYYNDFRRTADFDVTNDWTVTETQAGATQAISDDLFPSHLRLTNTSADNDVNAVLFTGSGGSGETYKAVAGKKRYFTTCFRLGDVDADASSVEQQQTFLGFQITNTDQLGETTAVSDYIGFHKADGTGLFQFCSGKNNVTTGNSSMIASAATQIVPVSTGLTLAAADAVDSNGTGLGVWHRLSFLAKYTAAAVTAAEFFVWVDGVHVQSVYRTAGICDDEEMGLCFAQQAGEAEAKVLDIANVMTWFEY